MLAYLLTFPDFWQKSMLETMNCNTECSLYCRLSEISSTYKTRQLQLREVNPATKNPHLTRYYSFFTNKNNSHNDYIYKYRKLLRQTFVTTLSTQRFCENEIRSVFPQLFFTFTSPESLLHSPLPVNHKKTNKLKKTMKLPDKQFQSSLELIYPIVLSAQFL